MIQSSLPKISIITVSFNHAEFIRQNIESVLQQNYPNFEHIIVDGASTDGTIEILRSYPHLKWTSEKDRGQSDALNKGFAQATGDIIGWLNSDDWYAPNIFFDVAEAIADCPIVVGIGQETDKEGNPRQTVLNTERGFFDVLKYWVPFAWLAQPAIFFSKSLLEAAKRPNGEYIDESLFFTMDYDLWVRMAARVDFRRHIDKVLAYYRIYDENKTGKYPVATQRECGRVFRRYSYALSDVEHMFSIVLPIAAISPGFSETLKSIAAQNLRDIEILFVDHSNDQATSKRLREIALELSNAFDHNSVRLITSSTPNLFHALNEGIKAACALFVVTLQQGDVINPDFLLSARDLFLPDCQGMALALSWNPELKNLMYDHSQHGLEIKIGNIFKMPYIYPNIIARKLCLLEVGGFRHEHIAPFAFRELIARVAHKSWAISVNNSLPLSPVMNDKHDEEELLRVFEPYINADILTNLNMEFERDPFAQVRLENQITFSIPHPLLVGAQKVLAVAPPDWHTMSFLGDSERLNAICHSYPDFAPAWYFLSPLLERNGEQHAAKEARENFNKLIKQQSEWY